MRISYEDFSRPKESFNDSNKEHFGKYIKYFSLKNDGDEAIVRFMYDDPSQFDILNIHTTKVNQWDTHFNCIRDPKDPIDNCPLCKAGIPLRCNFFIKLIQYTNDGNSISAEAKIWQRSSSYVRLIKSLMDEYSPISDYLFKIKRVGKAGDKNTTYNIIPCNPSVYSSEVYKKDSTLFEGYSVLGGIVQDKSYNDLASIVHMDVPNSQPNGNVSNPASTPNSISSTTTSLGDNYNSQYQETPRRQYTASSTSNTNNQFTPRRY